MYFVQTETNQVDSGNPKYEDTGMSIALKPLQAKQQITVSLPLGQVSTGKMNTHVHLRCMHF